MRKDMMPGSCPLRAPAPTVTAQHALELMIWACRSSGNSADGYTQSRRSGASAGDSGGRRGQASQASAVIGAVGSAIQPSRLAEGSSSGSGRRVRPRAAARAVSAAMTASRASFEVLHRRSCRPSSSHGAAACSAVTSSVTAAGLRGCLYPRQGSPHCLSEAAG